MNAVPENIMQLAIQAFQAGNYVQASAYLEAKLAADPLDWNAWHLAGICHHQNGANGKAADCVGRAIEINPNFFGLYNTLGRIRLAQKQLDAALAAFQKELSLNKRDDAYAYVANVLLMLGRTQEAAVCLESAIAYNPKARLNRLTLMRVYCLVENGDLVASILRGQVKRITGELVDNQSLAEAAFLDIRLLAELCQLANFYLLMRSGRYHDKVVSASHESACFIGQLADKYGQPEIKAVAADLLGNFITIDSRSHFSPKTPGTLQIEPTSECNLACPMCPRTTDMTRKAQHLTWPLWNEIQAGWASDLNDIGYFTNTKISASRMVKLFFLGEPLLHPQLGRFIEDAKRRNITVHVQTNGVPLKNPRQRSSLLKSGASVIGISIDGHDEASYKFARDGADWHEIVSNVRALCRERDELGLKHCVSIQCTNIIYDKNDFRERERIVEFMRPLTELTDSLNIIPLGTQHDPVYFDALNHPKNYHCNEKPNQRNISTPTCSEPLNKLNVLSDGTITPCCVDTNGKGKLGHVSDGIDNVWNGNQAKKLREAHLSGNLENFPYCRACLGFSTFDIKDVPFYSG